MEYLKRECKREGRRVEELKNRVKVLNERLNVVVENEWKKKNMRWKVQEMSNVVWVYAVLEYEMNERVKNVMEQGLDEMFQRKRQELSGETVSIVMWSFKTMKYRPSDEFMKKWMRISLEFLNKSSPQSLTHSIYAYVSVIVPNVLRNGGGNPVEEYLERWLVAFRLNMGAFQCAELTTTLYSLGKLRWMCEKGGYSCGDGEVLMDLMDGFFGMHEECVQHELYAMLLVRIDEFNEMKAFVNVFYGMAKLKFNVTESIFNEMWTKFERMVKNSSGISMNEVSSVILSLSEMDSVVKNEVLMVKSKMKVLEKVVDVKMVEESEGELRNGLNVVNSLCGMIRIGYHPSVKTVNEWMIDVGMEDEKVLVRVLWSVVKILTHLRVGECEEVKKMEKNLNDVCETLNGLDGMRNWEVCELSMVMWALEKVGDGVVECGDELLKKCAREVERRFCEKDKRLDGQCVSMMIWSVGRRKMRMLEGGINENGTVKMWMKMLEEYGRGMNLIEWWNVLKVCVFFEIQFPQQVMEVCSKVVEWGISGGASQIQRANELKLMMQLVHVNQDAE
uniref:Uncharacterized protein n=1 Tax=Timspurckia oligopyrenoides TaxID=708627 RepID=A0A7S1EPL0_9RHOD